MVAKEKINNDEIDILKIILIIWRHKWKVLFITAIIFSLVILIESNRKPIVAKYLAKTEIWPITTFEEFKYRKYNTSVRQIIFQEHINDKTLRVRKLDENSTYPFIDKSYLESLFIDKINSKEPIIHAIKKYGFIKRENYKNDLDFQKEILRLSTKVKLVPPLIEKKNGRIVERSESTFPWIIEFETDKPKIWLEVLKLVEKKTNEEIQIYLKNSFNQIVAIENELKNNEIEDLDIKMKNSIKNYEDETIKHIIFLKEQAAIARKNNLATNNFKTIMTDIPYYLRGYETIEEEIKLIENRENMIPFNKGYGELLKLKNELLSNRNIERIEDVFQSTPIAYSKNFKSAQINIQTTKFENLNRNLENTKIKIIFFGGIFGLLIAIFYVLLMHSTGNRNRKINEF